jgi:hypothetical protein
MRTGVIRILLLRVLVHLLLYHYVVSYKKHEYFVLDDGCTMDDTMLRNDHLKAAKDLETGRQHQQS